MCRSLVFISDSPTKINPNNSQSVWELIHRYPIENANNWDRHKGFLWYLNSWLPLVPRFLPNGASCGCATHWMELTNQQEYKPDFTSAEACEYWIWKAHNAVSRNHSGAREISFEQSQKLWRSPRVGFLATSYMPIGGTETWHRTLLPELRHHVRVIGFWADMCLGDTSLLKVPIFSNPIDLVNSVDVIVTWGVSLSEIIHKVNKKPYVISVHHSDLESPWSDYMSFLPEVDRVVTVNKDVPNWLKCQGLKIPVDYVPNPVKDPTLTWTPDTPKYVLWPHRTSNEKQPDLAKLVASKLPDGWSMVMTTEGVDTDKVRYVGKITNESELGQLLAHSSCLISLATFEGFGYSIAEALRMGVPVVSYAKGLATDELVTVIPPNANADDIAALCVSAKVKEPMPLQDHNLQNVVGQWANLITTH